MSFFLLFFLCTLNTPFRGRILLCVPPTHDDDAIRAVKWHPKDADTLAIASDNKVFVIDLANTQDLQGHSLPHSDLYHLGPVFNVPSVSVPRIIFFILNSVM